MSILFQDDEERDFVEIPLSQGYVALVSKEDAERVKKHKWSLQKIQGQLYAKRNANGNGQRIYIFLHKFILNVEKGMEVDHRNRNGLDNRRCNLRAATRSQNSYNKKKRVDNKTGYRGVCFVKAKHKFSVAIYADKTRYFLGYYKDAETAAKVYDEKAFELHGEFASLNFPHNPKFARTN